MRKSTFISVLILSLLCGSGIALSAQNRNLFLELGGSGGLGSLNYEKWIPLKPHKHTGFYGHECPDPILRYTLRGGIGLTPVDKDNGWVIVLPLMANIVFGQESMEHRIEIGAGVAPSFTTKGNWFIKSPLFLGYRYQPNEKPFFIRAGYTPIIGWLVDYNWQHWAGISIGYKLT